MGAGGRDFHNFNVVYRDDPQREVIAFTAAQIPNLAGRVYPPGLAGRLYPDGIPIRTEAEVLPGLKDLGVEEVVFSYSDVSHLEVMHAASAALASGANFTLLGPLATQLAAPVPVVAVCATRTGAGKSQTTRRIAEVLKDAGVAVVVVRHPMAYGDLSRQAVQRFASAADIDAAGCTIEEREEYEPHVAGGRVVFAGVDYAAILERASAEAQVILWDGGNNDFPFYRTDLLVVVVDPLRPGHEVAYHPGEANLRMADVIVVNKVDSASSAQLEQVMGSIGLANPKATVVRAESKITVSDPAAVAGARVLVVEDGPTLTHGGMEFGAGVVAARRLGAAEIVDPRDAAVGSLRAAFASHPLGPLLPAMGYGPSQVGELEQTINAVDADLVLVASPVDLAGLMHIKRPVVRVGYELAELGPPSFEDLLAPLIDSLR